jgi:HJR/Mrr/RecB family endonuclease
MRTYIGKVNCNYENCELVLQDYTAVGHGSDLINLEQDAKYTVEMNYDDFGPSIYVINSHTKEKVIKLSAFYDAREGRHVHLPFDEESTFNKINIHINKLNEYYERRIDSKRNGFREDILIKVEECKPDSIVRTMIYNFIALNPPMIIYGQNHYLQMFELIIYDNFSIGQYLLQTYGIYKNNRWLLRSLDVENLQDRLTEYYDNFMNLVRVIKKRENIDSDEKAIYYTWILFNEEVCHYYFNKFNDEYGTYFLNIEDLSLQAFIEIYSKIDLLNMESIDNICMFTFYLMYLKKFDENSTYVSCHNIVNNEISIKMKEKEMDEFEALLLKTPSSRKVFIADIDLMSGYEFETFISELFRKMGYTSTVTKGSGDQGIDILAEKNGMKYGIQTKCYSGSVSNKAIQEVVAGLNYYNLDRGIVVTNNYFTESAKKLALSNNVILWDRNILKEKISEMF